jgi:hypothetical protein
MNDEIQKVTLGTNEALRVTADGEFIWHPEADAMIEEGDFTSSPAMRHILRALRKALAAPVQDEFDIRGMLASKLTCWNRLRETEANELVALVASLSQPAPVQEPVAWHAMAKRRVFDAIRGAYDLGYNDARSARAVHGDSAPGYKGRDVEADHGGALISALERYTTPPAAKRQWVGLTLADREKLRDQFEGWNYPAILVDAVSDILKEKNT